MRVRPGSILDGSPCCTCNLNLHRAPFPLLFLICPCMAQATTCLGDDGDTTPSGTDTLYDGFEDNNDWTWRMAA